MHPDCPTGAGIPKTTRSQAKNGQTHQNSKEDLPQRSWKAHGWRVTCQAGGGRVTGKERRGMVASM